MHIEHWQTGATAPNDGAMRTAMFRLILDRYFANYKKTMVDLGAGPCIFAKIARDRGHKVTAVDARDVRVPNDLGSIEFVHADVRDFDIRPFDVVVCLGLFYHFDIEDQLALLKRCVGRPLILDSQVHVRSLVVPNTGDWQYDVVKRDSYEGVIFPEGNNPMASVVNPTSFWHTEASILRMFEDAGFREVIVLDPVFTTKYGGRRMYFCPETSISD